MVNQLSALADETATSSREIRGSKSLAPRQIPWGYGRDRVTAIAVDPIQLFVYWEVRDESIETSRAQLGPSGTRAALTLRIYDTTGRIFDGTNAHSHFDQEVQRNDRQWFCNIGKPSSSAHVEMGLKSPDGRFARITRSGRVDFPRAAPATSRPPEWMRVVASTGDVVSRETAPAQIHVQPPHPAPSDSSQADSSGGSESIVTSGVRLLDGSFDSYALDGYELKQIDYERYETDTGWQTDALDASLFHRVITTSWQEIGFGAMSWESGPTESSWEAGPFQYPTQVIVPAAERFEGPTQVYRLGEQVRILHGPWQVVIRGIQAHASRRVLARWEVHRSWVSSTGRVADTPLGADLPGVKLGSSERQALSASELRLRGASEVFFLGASERRFMGASETRFLGASQWMARGASERRFMGASEWRLMGASERRLMGASERRLMGASERLMLGASERRAGGASERRLAASEPRLARTPNGSAKG
jgi:hypothetical protein